MKTARQVFDEFWECVAEQRFDDARALIGDDFVLALPGISPLGVDEAIGVACAWKAAFANFGELASRIVRLTVEGKMGVALVLEEELLHTGPFVDPCGSTLEPYNPPRRVTIKSTHVLVLDNERKIGLYDITFVPSTLTDQMQ